MEFQEILDSRRSIRSYDAAKKVTKEQVEELIEAALQAPSWKNSETARYHCVLNEDVIAKIREEALPAFNQKSSAGAALIVATFVKDVSGYTKGEPDNELGNGWGCYDLGFSNANFIMKARELGLGTLIMGIRNEAKIREILSIPEEECIVAVIAGLSNSCRSSEAPPQGDRGDFPFLLMPVFYTERRIRKRKRKRRQQDDESLRNREGGRP